MNGFIIGSRDVGRVAVAIGKVMALSRGAFGRLKIFQSRRSKSGTICLPLGNLRHDLASTDTAVGKSSTERKPNWPHLPR